MDLHCRTIGKNRCCRVNAIIARRNRRISFNNMLSLTFNLASDNLIIISWYNPDTEREMEVNGSRGELDKEGSAVFCHLLNRLKLSLKSSQSFVGQEPYM